MDLAFSQRPPVGQSCPGLLVLTKRQLAKLGVDCEVVEDPLQALEMLKTGSYAVALVDIGMPKMSGIELTRQLRAAERSSGDRTPVIALTANHGSKEDFDRYREAGMDGQLTKPASLDQLASTLHRWFAPGTSSSATAAAAETTLPARFNNDGAPIDFARFRAIHGSDDAATRRDIFRLFIDAAPGELESLSGAVAARDKDQTNFAAHRFKSVAGNTAALRLADLLQQLELEAQGTADWDALDSGFDSVREEYRTVTDYMRTRL